MLRVYWSVHPICLPIINQIINFGFLWWLTDYKIEVKIDRKKKEKKRIWIKLNDQLWPIYNKWNEINLNEMYLREFNYVGQLSNIWIPPQKSNTKQSCVLYICGRMSCFIQQSKILVVNIVKRNKHIR